MASLLREAEGRDRIDELLEIPMSTDAPVATGAP
jgi:hypothetical protein